MFLVLLLMLLGIYAGLIGWLALRQDQLIFRPHRGRVAPADWGLGDFRIIQAATGDGLFLDGWYRPADGFAKPTIVILPGNGGHPGLRAQKARGLADAGYGVLIAGYRGYAGNDGVPSMPGLVADGRAALDYLISQGISGHHLVLYGESLGTAVAIALAAERRIASLILEAPFTRLADLAASRYPLVPVRALLRHHADCAAAIAHVRAPVLILHGRADRTVPVHLGEALEKAITSPVRSWRPSQAGHHDLFAHGALGEILDFLAGGHRPAEGPILEQRGRPGAGTALIPRR